MSIEQNFLKWCLAYDCSMKGVILVFVHAYDIRSMDIRAFIFNI